MELNAQVLIAYHWRRYKKRLTKMKKKKKQEINKKKSGSIVGGKQNELPAHMKKQDTGRIRGSTIKKGNIPIVKKETISSNKASA